MGAYVSLHIYIVCVCVWSEMLEQCVCEMREQCVGEFSITFTEGTKSEGERERERDGGEMGLLRQSLARVGKDLIY